MPTNQRASAMKPNIYRRTAIGLYLSEYNAVKAWADSEFDGSISQMIRRLIVDEAKRRIAKRAEQEAQQ